MTTTTLEPIHSAASSDQAGTALSAPPPGAAMILRPSKGWSALRLGEVIQFRDLLFTLAGRDLRLRYKQTALGMIWVVLQPLMAAGIFTVVFGKIANLEHTVAVPYFLFAFAGQLGWAVFSNTVTKVSGCLVGNAHLISKVYFPRLVLPLSTIPSTLVDFGVAAVMMVGLMIWFQVAPGMGLLLLPVWMAALFAAGMGMGLIAAALSVTYRDVSYILPVFLQMLMYASPVAYGVESVPASVKGFFLWNPLTPILEGFRWSLLPTAQPNWAFADAALGTSLLMLLIGVYLFKRMERRFADVV